MGLIEPGCAGGSCGDDTDVASVSVQEAMGPRLAVLQEQCQRLGLSSDRAETLLMLIEDATVPQVLETLQKYSEHFEAVRFVQPVWDSPLHPACRALVPLCHAQHPVLAQLQTMCGSGPAVNSVSLITTW